MLYPIGYYSFVAPQNTCVFAKISFYIYSSFLSISSIFLTLKPRLRGLFLSFLHFASFVLAVFLAVTQLSSCGAEGRFARCVQRNDTCDNAKQLEVAQQQDPHAQNLKIIAASIQRIVGSSILTVSLVLGFFLVYLPLLHSQN